MSTTLLLTMTVAATLLVVSPRSAPAQPLADCLEEDSWCPVPPWRCYHPFPLETSRLDFTDRLMLINYDNSVVFLPPMPKRAPAERWTPFDERIQQSAAKIRLPKSAKTEPLAPAIPQLSLIPSAEPRESARKANASPALNPQPPQPAPPQ
jgi:hypothetical protein